jgi:hypothetical protein
MLVEALNGIPGRERQGGAVVQPGSLHEHRAVRQSDFIDKSFIMQSHAAVKPERE